MSGRLLRRSLSRVAGAKSDEWYNIDPSKGLIYGLSKLRLAERLVRFDPGDRARSRS
jgi:fatty-acid desaturase